MAFISDLTLVGTAGDDILRGEEDAESRDFIVGSSGNDLLAGGRGNDFLLGGNGDDKLRGNADEDILYGGRGDDDLRGGRDGDVLNGDFGADFLRGDSFRDPGYADTFLFSERTAGFADRSGGFAADTVADFEAGIDTLQFAGYSELAIFSFEQDGGDVIVSVDRDGAGEEAALHLATLLNADAAEAEAAALYADFVI